MLVEMHSRRSQEFGAPEKSLSKNQQEHLIYTAQLYMMELASAPGHWRVDLIAVVLDDNSAVQRINHLENTVQGE